MVTFVLTLFYHHRASSLALIMCVNALRWLSMLHTTSTATCLERHLFNWTTHRRTTACLCLGLLLSTCSLVSSTSFV